MTLVRGWKAVKPDLTTRGGFKWWPGTTVRSDDNLNSDNHSACPTRVGDGLTIARTWGGASFLGVPTLTCVIVEYDSDNVLAETFNKIRVAGEVKVLDVYDAQALLRQGFGRGANLQSADLRGANLANADLQDANLFGAFLGGAVLYKANLCNADLRYATLPRTNMSHANLNGADLAGANLSGAFLNGANLGGTNLSGVNLGGWERSSTSGFAVQKGKS